MAEMDQSFSDSWQKRYEIMVENMEEILFDKTFGSYFDFNHVTENFSRRYYSSNFVPLYFKDYPIGSSAAERDDLLLDFLKRNKVLGKRFNQCFSLKSLSYPHTVGRDL